MDEAMNLSGINNVPLTNSDANSVVLEENQGVQNPVVAEIPEVSPVPLVPSVENEAAVNLNISDEMSATTPVVASSHEELQVEETSPRINPLPEIKVEDNFVSPLVNSKEAVPTVPELKETDFTNGTPVEAEKVYEASPVLEETSQVEVPKENLKLETEEEVSAMGKELFEQASTRKSSNLFSNLDFGPLKPYIDEDDITDISYSNGGQLWLQSLSRGVYRAEEQNVNDALIEKIAFQCSNVMGKTFNMAHPSLDAESTELRMSFIHDSIARNGIAAVFRKTPAKIRLKKEKLLEEKYITLSVHDFLIKAVQAHCNIIVSGETGSGKTELVKYLASHTAYNEKIITIEDTLELHLDRIYPERDIVAMKTNNIASYTDVLITCMRQNPKWILLSEVRSAEAVTAVRNSISSGHNILSTIHADKAESIPLRMYSLLESDIDVEQFLTTIHRYVHLGVFVRGRFDPKENRFVREVGEVTEFFVDENNVARHNTIYKKNIEGLESYNSLSPNLLEYLEGQGTKISELENFANLNPNSEFSAVQVDSII